MAIKLIIFDLGGVIVDFTEEKYMHYIAKKTGVSYRRFASVLLPLVPKLEKGLMTEKELEHALMKKVGIKEREIEWGPGFRKTAKLNRNVFNLVENLSKSYDVVILTNISYSRYKEAKRAFLDNLHVEKVYETALLRMRKPEPRVYRYVLKHQGVKPNEALFIDNQIENVRGGRRVGIDSILFKNYAQLAKELDKRGILE